MSQPKHAPGPWVVQFQFNDTNSYPTSIVSRNAPTLRESINPKEPNPDAKLPICSFTHEAREFTIANARLIAAAPEMLEMLMLIQLDGYNSKALDALIKKAKGGAE